MKRAAGLARKATTSATAAGGAASPAGSIRFRAASMSPKKSRARVSIMPGATAFTSTPSHLSSIAMARVMATTAALEAT